MNEKKLRRIWDGLFEYDRIAEKRIKKSIRLWNSNRFINHVRAMILYNRIRKKYNCSVNPRIKCGEGLYISHAQDIVIGQTSEIGNNCRIYPGAKLIAKVEGDLLLVENNMRRHPKIGDNCMLGADCLVIGPITIGNNVTIAAGAIVTKNIPDNSIVIETNKVLNGRAK